MRSIRSACVPSFSWNVMPENFGSRDSNVVFLSCSQKNFASDSRARMTRAFPALIAAPPSFASRLETRMNLLASFLPPP